MALLNYLWIGAMCLASVGALCASLWLAVSIVRWFAGDPRIDRQLSLGMRLYFCIGLAFAAAAMVATVWHGVSIDPGQPDRSMPSPIDRSEPN